MAQLEQQIEREMKSAGKAAPPMSVNPAEIARLEKQVLREMKNAEKAANQAEAVQGKSARQ